MSFIQQTCRALIATTRNMISFFTRCFCFCFGGNPDIEEPIEMNTESIGFVELELGNGDEKGVALDEQIVKWNPACCLTKQYMPRIPISRGVEVDFVPVTGESSRAFVSKPVPSGCNLKSIADCNTLMMVQIGR